MDWSKAFEFHGNESEGITRMRARGCEATLACFCGFASLYSLWLQVLPGRPAFPDHYSIERLFNDKRLTLWYTMSRLYCKAIET